MTPYSNIDRVLTDEEWLVLRQWLKDHPDQRSHLGDKRQDGKCFIGYAQRSRGGEHWGKEQIVLNTRERMRLNYAIKKNTNPDYVRTLLAQRKERKLIDADFRERDRQYKQEWKQTHPEVESAGRMRRALRRMGKESAMHPDLNQEAVEKIYLLAIEQTKIITPTSECHVDHIIPITYGGWHHQDNLQVLPQALNQSKNNNPFWEHPDYKSWRDVPRSLWPSGLAPIYSVLLAFPPIYPL